METLKKINLDDIKIIFSKHHMKAYDDYVNAKERYKKGLITLEALRSKRDQYEAIRQMMTNVIIDIEGQFIK